MHIPLLADGNSRALVFYYTGNGSATFDPSLTLLSASIISWKPDDAPETLTSGTSHSFSYVPSPGYHKCVMRVIGGLRLVQSLDFNSDCVLYIRGLSFLSELVSVYAYYNLTMSGLRISNFPKATVLSVGQSNVEGLVSEINRSATFVTPHYSNAVYGLLSDFPVTIQTLYAMFSPNILPSSIALFVALRDIRIYSMWSSLSASESVDIVIDSMWAARANYTYATPSLQIGGTNPAPTGNYIAPEEGPDWHNDGSKWIPLTPNAKAFDLGNDVNTEGFNTWTITKN